MYDDPEGRLRIAVKGKGGKWRIVPILEQCAEDMRALVAGKSPHERLFTGIPSHLDVHASRRGFAQVLYRQASGRPLPLAQGRLEKGGIDPAAAQQVSRALGHNRLDVTMTHYLR